jgi:hypothetical protein
MKGCLVLIVLVVSLLVAGCTTQPAMQNNVTQTPEPTISQTIALPSGEISYTDENARWPMYTNPYDHYRIYYPKDWILVSIDSPYREPSMDMFGKNEQLRKQVSIYPPASGGRNLTSANGMILLTGYTLIIPNKTYTQKELNDIFSSRFADEMQNAKSVTNVEVDSKVYLIHGSPATHLTYDGVDGVTTYEYFQVVHNYSFYSLLWAGNKTYAPTASQIMRTFDPF